MSTYFNGSVFRAIDALATTDGEHVTSALEAQQANNAHYLHINDGGQIHKIYPCRDATGASAKGMWLVSSSVWAAVHYQPYTVLRGLKTITITWFGDVQSVDGHNTQVRLELIGVGSVDAIWLWSSGSNVVRTITLTLPQPSEFEGDTDLVLWMRSPIGATLSGTSRSANVTEGVVEVTTGTCLSTTYARGIARLRSGGLDGSASNAVLEPIVRNTAVTLSTGSAGDIAVIVDAVEGAFQAREVSLCALNTRSIMIRTSFE